VVIREEFFFGYIMIFLIRIPYIHKDTGDNPKQI